MLTLALEGEFEEASNKYLLNVQAEGVPVDALVREFEWQLKKSDLEGEAKMRAMDALGELDWRLRRGANPQVQVNRFLAVLPAVRYTDD